MLPSLSVRLKVGSRTIKLSPFSYNHFYAANYNQEQWMSLILNQFQKNETVRFIDVGCNIGQTMLKVLEAYEKVSYIGFDANKYCVSYCQELINNNNLQESFAVIHCALGEQNGLINIPSPQNLDKFNSSLSVIEGFRGEETKNTVMVPCFQFDSILSDLDIDGIDVVKIDVEGAELNVLLGMKDMLKQFMPIILMEVLPVYDAKNKERLVRQKEIEKLLLELEYEIYRISKVDTIGFDKIEEFGIHSNLEMCDYICISKNSKQILKLK